MSKLILIFLLNVYFVIGYEFSYHPEQIHIAFGDADNEIVVVWSTLNATSESVVKYGQDENNLNLIAANGPPRKFVDGGSERRTQYIHEVHLKGLKYDTYYVYRCGSPLGWSRIYYFKTKPEGNDWSPRLAIFGDLGVQNGYAFPMLERLATNFQIDAIVHLGDFAYDFQDDNGRIGDEFMRKLEPIAARIPYMVVIGNHEKAYNFSHYKERFVMPGKTDNMYYTFNMGPIRFVAFSTEHYYFEELNLIPDFQYAWLETEMKNASDINSRNKRPWLITLGHRPMYCTNLRNVDCKNHETKIRTGDINRTTEFALEPLFYKYNVDLAMWGHEHSYERFWPVYNFKVINGSRNQPYVNPKAPIHVISGAAGSKFPEEDVPTTYMGAFRTIEPSITILQVFNRTHLFFEQVSALTDNVIDSAWIVKDESLDDSMVDVEMLN